MKYTINTDTVKCTVNPHYKPYLYISHQQSTLSRQYSRATAVHIHHQTPLPPSPFSRLVVTENFLDLLGPSTKKRLKKKLLLRWFVVSVVPVSVSPSSGGFQLKSRALPRARQTGRWACEDARGHTTSTHRVSIVAGSSPCVSCV